MSEHSDHSGSVEHVVPVTTYVSVFLALIALTALTTGVAYIDLGRWNTVAALAIAVIKMLLVVHAREICCRLNPDRYFGRLLLAINHDHFNAVRRADTRLGNRLAWLGRDDSAATPSILGDIYQAHGVGVRLKKRGPTLAPHCSTPDPASARRSRPTPGFTTCERLRCKRRANAPQA